MQAPRGEVRSGERIGAYQAEAVLGRGGAGIVYLAEHEQLGRKAAVKVLSVELADDDAFRARVLTRGADAGGARAGFQALRRPITNPGS